MQKNPIKKMSYTGAKRRTREKLRQSLPASIREKTQIFANRDYPETLREKLSIKNLFYAVTLPWRASGSAFIAAIVGVYALQNITASWLPDVDAALGRYNLTRKDVPDLPEKNLRFRFGGEASSLHSMLNGENMLMNTYSYMRFSRPAGDHAIATTFTYHYLNNKLTGLCTISSKTPPALGHQAFAAISGIDPEYAAYLVQGREKAFSLYILLHEIRHCHKDNAALSGSAREADSDLFALRVIRNLPQYPNIEDLVLVARARAYMGGHDTALSVAAFMRGQSPLSQDDLKAAAERMNAWARPHAGPYARVNRGISEENDTKLWLKNWLHETIFGLAPNEEPNTQAYLMAWHDHKDRKRDTLDQHAFDRLELMLGAMQGVNPQSFAQYQVNTGINFEPTSSGRFARIKAIEAQERAADTAPAARP